MPTAAQIAYQLSTKLSPPGALTNALNSTLRNLWTGIADELAHIYGRVVDLLNEAHPSTTNELLTDWETEYDLPDPCVTTSQTVNDRRQAVQIRFRSVGGQSRSYFIGLAASFAIAINIVEERPFEIGLSGMGDGIGGGNYAFTWSVLAPASTTTAQRQLLECTFQRLKPAYTTVVFFYT